MRRFLQLWLVALLCVLHSTRAGIPLVELVDYIEELEDMHIPAFDPLVALQNELLGVLVEYEEAEGGQKREETGAESERDKRAGQTRPYYLNVHINLVTVGLEAEALQPWIAAVSQEETLANLVLGSPPPAASLKNVGYRYCFNLYEVPVDVKEFIGERLSQMALKTSDIDSSSSGNNLYYLLSWEVEEFLHSLSVVATSFDIEHNVAHEMPPVYSLFLLNVLPAFVDRAGEGGEPVSYGYQWGFSQEHMKQLVQDPRIIDAAKARLRSEQLRRVYKHERSTKRPDEARDAQEDSWRSHWREPLKPPESSPCVRHVPVATAARDWMQQIKTRTANEQQQQQPAYPTDVVARALRLLESSAPSVSKHADALAREVLQWQSYVDAQLASSPEPTPSCSSPTWIGHRNVSWVDLQSGVVGPSPMMASTRPIPRLPAEQQPVTSDHHESLGGRSPEFVEQMRQENAALQSRLQRRATRLQGLREQISCPADAIPADQQPPHCAILKQQTALLGSVLELSAKLAREEERVAASVNDNDHMMIESLYDAAQIHNELLREASELTAPFSSPEAPQRVRDTEFENKFYADIAGFVQEFSRHIITPTTALPAASSDATSSIDDDVIVQIYVVKQRSTFEPLTKQGQGGFDINAFVNGTRDLLAPWQSATFTTMVVPLDDDLFASLGLCACARSAVVAALDQNQRYTSTLRQYLDSTCTVKALKHDQEAMGNAERGRKAISVFVVSVDLPQPLFLDRVHVAKAIDDTVLIVQNSQLTIPSNVLCNGRLQTIYGRNPLREALSATAHALHGLLPSHAADQRHHDWAWASGSSPLQSSCPQPMFSSHDNDVVHRTSLLQQLSQVAAFLDRAKEAAQEARSDFYDPDHLEQFELEVGRGHEAVKKCLRFMTKRDWRNARGAVAELLGWQHRLSQHELLQHVHGSETAGAGELPGSTPQQSVGGAPSAAVKFVSFCVGAAAAAFLTHRLLGADAKVKGY